MLISDYLNVTVCGEMTVGGFLQLCAILVLIGAVIFVVKKRDFNDDY